jgi:hypothetical protein
VRVGLLGRASGGELCPERVLDVREARQVFISDQFRNLISLVENRVLSLGTTGYGAALVAYPVVHTSSDIRFHVKICTISLE